MDWFRKLNSPGAPPWKLPSSLFRYKAIDKFLSGILVDNTLWFSAITKMNDPCESFYTIKLGWTDETARHLYRSARAQAAEFSKIVDEIRKAGHISEAEISKAVSAFDGLLHLSEDEAVRRMRPNTLILDPDVLASLKETQRAIDERTILLCCFTESGASPYMSHSYADKHCGVCLEFDTSYFPMKDAVPVHYQEAIPILDQGGDAYGMQVARMQTKSLEWLQEKEWRLFAHPAEGTTRQFAPEALKSVSFGHAAEPTKIREVLSQLSDKLNKKTVKVFQFRPDASSYTLIRGPLQL
jgi:hypothetical protein